MIRTCCTRFIKDNDEGCGWIMKTPFSCNGHNKKWAYTLEDIIKKIEAQYEELYVVIP